MNKKIIILIVALFVVLAGIAAWWFLFRSPVAVPKETPFDATAQAVDAAQSAQASVGESVGKTNPFSADINPAAGYKNPFE